MAIIYSLSPKLDEKRRQEILIRYKVGKISARAKSNIFVLSDWYSFVTGNNTDTPFKGKRTITEVMKGTQSYHEQQKTKLAEMNIRISEASKTADRSNSEWLKTAIDKYNFPEKYAPKVAIAEKPTLFRFISGFIDEASNRKDKDTGRNLSKATIKQYKVAEKWLKEFAGTMQRNDFDFNEIDQSFYNKFVEYLQGKNYTQNNIGKNIKQLKVFLNEAKSQGRNNQEHYKSFHVFTEDTDTIYLNEAELQQLKDADFSKIPHHDRVRDCFLLLAWTGSRFSDLKKIAKTDIKDGFITFRQQKTNAKVVIPLHPVVSEILEKYNYNLPAEISNQRFNEYVKEVCKLAEINGTETMTRTVGGKLVTEKFEKWEHVSSHTGRRSFCTNMYKRGLPVIMIMSVSGHRTEKSFLKYIKVKQNEHAEMMKKAWENMYKQYNV
ncbi:MAG: site-specific integrase, partial [Prevotellaceae bacterium]|nr:site-specific integrase [Prevotellaceae bacterium]